jgi:large subunit ribosomal protein L45
MLCRRTGSSLRSAIVATQRWGARGAIPATRGIDDVGVAGGVTGVDYNHHGKVMYNSNRSYAKPSMKGVTAPASAGGSRGRGMRIAPQSPNLIAEPYAGPMRRPSVLEAFTSAKGLRFAYEAAMSRVKDTYALSKCTKDIRGFTLEGFKAEAKQLYRMINASSANAGGGKTLPHDVRHATTDRTQTDLKRERKTRESGGWVKVDWDLVGIDECQVVRGRLIMANPNDTNGPGFVQLTTRFRSRQKFAAYDARGRLVSGDPDETLDVEDFWVFEHGLKIPNSRWRLAGRLHMPTTAQISSAPKR